MMPPCDKRVIAKNAASNVLRGVSSALVALALPPLLTRSLSPESYGAWALVLQLSAYVSYFDFGIQTAVGRFVAFTAERRDDAGRERIVQAALVLVSALAVVAGAATVLLAMFFTKVFPAMPLPLASEARVALLVMGITLAIGLPASVFNGIFVGVQRNAVPAVIVAVSRALSVAALAVAARSGASIEALAVILGAVNLGTYAVQYIAYRVLGPAIRLERWDGSRSDLGKFASYSAALSVWSLSMLLVSGLDVVLVARFDFSAVPYYAVAASAVTFLAGLQNAVFTAIIAPAAVLHARGDAHRLGRLLELSSRYGVFLLLLVGVPLMFAAGPLLRLWVGAAYAAQATLILQILVAGNMIRLTMTAYSSVLIATAQQRLATVSPLAEGVANLAISVVAGLYWGAIGVALGTVAGAIIGAGGHLLYNMPHTAGVEISLRRFVRTALLAPLACSLPMILAAAHGDTLAAAIGWGVTLACALSWGGIGGELRAILRRPVPAMPVPGAQGSTYV